MGTTTLFSATISGLTRTAPLAMPSGPEPLEVRYSGLADGQAPIRRRVRVMTERDAQPALCPPSADDMTEARAAP